jgi:hypothetical protein
MDRKKLIETNPHLRDPARYRKDLLTNVSSSTAVETGQRVDEVAKSLQTAFPPSRIKKAASEPSR